VVQVNKRCTDTGYAGLVLADWEVLASNGAPTVSVTVMVDDTQGQYTLTINDGAPAALTAGEYAVIQCSDEDATPTYLTYLSQALKVVAQ